jgi:hypothetical protein
MTGVFNRCRTGTAALLAAGLCSTAILPLINANPAAAQLFRRQPEDFRPNNYPPDDYRRNPDDRRTPEDFRRNNEDDRRENFERFDRLASLPAGTVIPTTRRDGDRILVKPDETLSIKLTVSNDVFAPRGGLLIPAGSEIEGRFEPTRGGTQFVAQQLRLRDGGTYDISATSPVITRIETIRRGAGTRTIVTGALAGGATATIISAALGEVGVLKSLGGAGVGALSGFLLGRRSVDVVVVDVKNDLELTLNNDLRLNN